MYMLSGGPFKRLDREGRLVAGRRGEQVRLMGASHDILHELVTTDHFRGSKVVSINISILVCAWFLPSNTLLGLRSKCASWAPATTSCTSWSPRTISAAP